MMLSSRGQAARKLGASWYHYPPDHSRHPSRLTSPTLSLVRQGLLLLLLEGAVRAALAADAVAGVGVDVASASCASAASAAPGTSGSVSFEAVVVIRDEAGLSVATRRPVLGRSIA